MESLGEKGVQLGQTFRQFQLSIIPRWFGLPSAERGSVSLTPTLQRESDKGAGAGQDGPKFALKIVFSGLLGCFYPPFGGIVSPQEPVFNLMTDPIHRLRAENEALRNEIAHLRRRIAHLERRAAPPRRGAEEGLADESYFLRRLKESVYSAERYARFLCVVMIDLPNEDRAEDGDRALETASRFASIFRKTDLVALFDSDRVYVLLEETETSQGIEALKRVQDEIGAFLSPRYSMACYPNDAQRDGDLLQLLEDRISKVCLFNAGGPAVNLGEEVLSLLN